MKSAPGGPDPADYRALRLERGDDLLQVTIDHPDSALNAVDDLLHSELARLFRELRREDRARAVVLTGAGRAFCAGQDLSGGGETFDNRDAERRDDQPAGWPALTPWQLRKPELASHVIVSRVAGLSNAADLLLTGRVVSGRKFAAMGLASEALPAAEVLPATLERAREFRHAAPASVAISKRLLWDGLVQTIPEIARQLARLAEAMNSLVRAVRPRPT